ANGAMKRQAAARQSRDRVAKTNHRPNIVRAIKPFTPAMTEPSGLPPTRAAARRIYLIDRPGSEQADFRIGNPAIARADADYYALLVANAILGDGTSSR